MQQLYPILEYDPAPEGIIEPRKLIKPIDTRPKDASSASSRKSSPSWPMKAG